MGIRRPALQRSGGGEYFGEEGEAMEGFGGRWLCPTASLSLAWGGVWVYFWAAAPLPPPPNLAPGGSLAGSGAEQAGGIFILEQHCRGGLVQELSVTAAAGEDLCWLPKLTPGPGSTAPGWPQQPPGHGSPHAGPGSLPGVFSVPLFEPCKGGDKSPTPCAGGEAAIVSWGWGN